MPFFSVVMPVYNCAPYLANAIGSVLTQTTRDFELIVIDDGSTDDPEAIVRGLKDPRMTFLRQENAGKAVAMNLAVSVASGDYIVVQDADDASEPDRLAVLAERLRRKPDLGGVLSGHALLFGDRVVAPRAEEKSRERVAAEIADLRLPAHDPTLAFRRDFALADPFSTDLPVMQGVDFIFRLAEALPVEVVGRSLYRYRIHGGSTTRRSIERRAACMRIVMDRAHARRGLPPLGADDFEARFGAASRDPSNNLIGHFIDSAYLQVREGDRTGALATAVEALHRTPFSGQSLKPLVYALAPRALAEGIRRRGRGARLSGKAG